MTSQTDVNKARQVVLHLRYYYVSRVPEQLLVQFLCGLRLGYAL